MLKDSVVDYSMGKESGVWGVMLCFWRIKGADGFITVVGSSSYCPRLQYIEHDYDDGEEHVTKVVIKIGMGP